jgi:hypothetical protein
MCSSPFARLQDFRQRRAARCSSRLPFFAFPLPSSFVPSSFSFLSFLFPLSFSLLFPFSFFPFPSPSFLSSFFLPLVPRIVALVPPLLWLCLEAP